MAEKTLKGSKVDTFSGVRNPKRAGELLFYCLVEIESSFLLDWAAPTMHKSITTVVFLLGSFKLIVN